MATIKFKAKKKQVFNMDHTLAFEYVTVPEFKHSHCNMHEFRIHPKYGSYANSDMFTGMLKRIRSTVFGGAVLRFDKPLNENITIDTSGFLVEVSIKV